MRSGIRGALHGFKVTNGTAKCDRLPVDEERILAAKGNRQGLLPFREPEHGAQEQIAPFFIVPVLTDLSSQGVLSCFRHDFSVFCEHHMGSQKVGRVRIQKCLALKGKVPSTPLPRTGKLDGLSPIRFQVDPPLERVVSTGKGKVKRFRPGEEILLQTSHSEVVVERLVEQSNEPAIGRLDDTPIGQVGLPRLEKGVYLHLCGILP